LGFFKFLKKKGWEKEEHLDLPPAPPNLEGMDKDIPSMPEMDDNSPQNMPPPPDMPSPDEEAPDFPSMPEMDDKALDIPPIAAPEQEDFPQVPAPNRYAQQPRREAAQKQGPIPDDYDGMDGKVYAEEKKGLRGNVRGNSIYLKVEDFKIILANINLIRSDLRGSKEALLRLENLKNSKEKSFDKIRNSLVDLQKKLIFVDKTFFKGE
jgi:hypothetical protein